MGNRCQRMLSEESDMSASYSRNRIRSSSSKKQRSFKERFLEPCVFLDCTGMKRGSPSSFDGDEVYNNDAIPKAEANQEPQLRQLTETEKSQKTSSASPNVIPRETLMPRDELNKEADDFIARMKGQMKIERKESDVEYLQRIERGAL